MKTTRRNRGKTGDANPHLVKSVAIVHKKVDNGSANPNGDCGRIGGVVVKRRLCSPTPAILVPTDSISSGLLGPLAW